MSNRLLELVEKLLLVSEVNYAHRVMVACGRGAQHCDDCAKVVCSDNQIIHDLRIEVARMKRKANLRELARRAKP